MIQTEVRDRLTDEILFGIEGGGTVTIGLKDGKLDFGKDLGAAESARYRVTRHHVMAEKSTRDSGQGRRSPLVGKSRCDGERASRVPPRVEADLRRAARTPGRRKGRAGSGVHRQVSAGRERGGFGSGARSRKTSSARGAGADRLLEVVDNLDRAIDAARRSSSPEALLQGVEMVQRQFLSKLEALGVKPIPADAVPFNPAVHEAVTTSPCIARAGRHGRRRHSSGIPDRRGRAAAGGGGGGEELDARSGIGDRKKTNSDRWRDRRNCAACTTAAK